MRITRSILFIAVLHKSSALGNVTPVDFCEHGECSDDETYFLQRLSTTANRSRAKAILGQEKSAGSCNPCINDDTPPLKFRIFNWGLTEVRPMVLAYHGKGGDDTSLGNLCKKIMVPAGYPCVTITPNGDETYPNKYSEAVIDYLTANSETYLTDTNQIFLYGYSRGGMSVLYFVMWTTDSYRSRVKGMISDSSSPGDGQFKWDKMEDGKYQIHAPYLSLHCFVDPQMKWKFTVKKTKKNIDEANSKRDADEFISHHVMRYEEVTGCVHMGLVSNSQEGKAAALSFIGAIIAGTDPYKGIPQKVETPDIIGLVY